ncbi:aminopeptidase [Bacillus mesophilus]|uniref:Aminopeptidase n=1 Tax=Bacillus mesophilus TaxID=1808955 RepID=A0A6M0Q9C5_9BACI|nr:aminopeptidase [Bacillus mesophilus]MBM7662387.1 aminopeptidase [Bacillus mesophilus]NEY72986.1 aminopeptidase [Bacillus mesophilus]
MNNFSVNLEKYAELTVKIGLNIQPGQRLLIAAPLVSATFVREVTKAAYRAGAKDVHIEWADEEITKIKLEEAPEEALHEFPTWKAKGYEEMAKDGCAYLSIAASNPDLLAGVDPDRIATMNKTFAQNMKGFRKMTQSSLISWCVVSVPTKEWAAKVFPNLKPNEQETALWEAIFSCTRSDLEDPVKAWEEHGKNLQSKVEYLNNKKYKKLHFKAPGTDLTIELPAKHIWVGGGAKTAADVKFTPNLPTEEVFTTPHREGVNGVVSSTKPLIYGGNMIDEFTLTFENGRIINYTAKVGKETLRRLIETDEGSHRLGELALVPHSSPISQSNILFYNTLYDENASNHFAIGSAYPICIENGTSMSTEELTEEGSNSSLTHVDFMIGSAKMDIDAENEDGKLEPLFRNGDWAI